MTTPERRSYEVRGEATQSLAPAFRHADASTTFPTSPSSRRITPTSTMPRGASASTRARHRELERIQPERHRTIAKRRFSGRPIPRSNGATPRLACRRSERPLFGRRSTSRSAASMRSSSARASRPPRLTDQGLDRIDFTPLIRFPFTRWPFLTVNSSVSLAQHLLDARARSPTAGATEPISRRYLRDAVRNRRPGLRPHLEYAEQRVHRAVQARRRAVLDIQRTTAHRQPRTDRPARRARLRSWATSRAYLRRQQPHLREAAKSDAPAIAREIISVVADAELLHRRAGRLNSTGQYRTSFTGVPPTRLLSDRARAARRPHRCQSSDSCGPNTTRNSWRFARSAPTAPIAYGELARASGGLEPAPVHRRAARFQRSEPSGPFSERRHAHSDARQPSGRGLLVQLRLSPRSYPAAADHRVLQRSVLRVRHRVPDVQFPAAGSARRSAVPQDRRFNFSLRSRASERSRTSFGALGWHPRPAGG